MKADRLDDAAIEAALASLSGWSRDGDVLMRSVRCAGWRAAIRVVDAVAEAADAQNHHPDICVTGYRHVTLRLTTHSEGGITHRDVDLAREIDALVDRQGGAA
jgi:4a-hydroxytetrahydrobiopterin dehydratase